MFITLLTDAGSEVGINPREVAFIEGENLAKDGEQPSWVTTLTLTTGGKKVKVVADGNGPRSRREIQDLLSRAAVR